MPAPTPAGRLPGPATSAPVDHLRRPALRRLGGGSRARSVGVVAIVASVSYFTSDVIEAVQGGFSTPQLWLTLFAEAAIPVFVIGFVLVLGPRLGLAGRIAAYAYAYAFTVFTGTVVYAIARRTEDYEALRSDLGALMAVHGVVMVAAGIGLGVVVIRRRLFPTWAAACLIVGVLLVAATQGMPVGVELVAAGVRDLAFTAFGVALVRRGGATPGSDGPGTSSPADRVG